MKHRGLKFLSLLLTLALLVGLLPGMTAFAAGETVYHLVGDGTVYLEGDKIKMNGKEFFISDRSNARPSTKIWKGVGSEPVVDSFGSATAKITGEYKGKSTEVDVIDTIEEGKQTRRTPIGVKIVGYYENVPGSVTNQIAVILELVYGYTVTYAPGDGARLNKDAIGEELKVKGESIVRPVTAENASTYKVESFDSYFIAPEGEHFDHWEDSDGNTYKYGDTINVSKNITLTAIWVPDSKPSSGSGSGGADIVFNIPGVDNTWEYVGGGVPAHAYRVSLAPMQGGSAALGLTTGESGTALNVYPTSTVYVFPNAEPGYTLDKIVWSLIDGSASYDITEAKNFVMPAMDVVVNVTFRPAG